MTGKYTNNLQAAILFDGAANICPGMHLNNFRMEMLQLEIPLNIVQESETFALMIGPNDLQITVTYNDHPANHAVFANTLKSGLTNLMMKDASDRVQRHSSHVLIEIQHGVLGGMTDNPEISSFFKEVGLPQPGHTLPAFNLRIDVLAAAIRHIIKAHPASAVHWTQSNMLVAGEKIEKLLADDRPGLLTVHPIIFGTKAMPGFKELPVGIATLGAADYIGREIQVLPAPIPWIDLYQTIMAFIRLALMPNGYIIPDNDTFAPEDADFSYRVNHLSEKDSPLPDGSPCYQLTLLYSKSHNYTSPDFHQRDLIPGGIAQAADMIKPHDDATRDQISDWQESEKLAQNAGGQFQVFKLRDKPQPTPGPKTFGPKTFGKRTNFDSK